MDNTRHDAELLVDIAQANIARSSDSGNWRVIRDEFWCKIYPKEYKFPAQGWKLHISATPLSAPIVLARASALLLNRGCAFKFAKDLEAVRQLTAADAAPGGSGKFITVYPLEDFAAIAEALDRCTEALPGPRIHSDKQLRAGSLIHYRYGVIAAPPVLDSFGRFVSMLETPDGQLLEDKRKIRFSPPAWVDDPFATIAASPIKEIKSVRLGNRYTVTGSLQHRNRGGVYLALDEQSGCNVVVKQSRAHVNCGLDGSSSQELIRHEALMLECLAPSGITPKGIELFEQQGDLFLAQELIPGITLDEWIKDKVSNKHAGSGLGADEAIAIISKLLDLLKAVHCQGLVLRDFKPANIMVQPDGELRLIDVEHAIEAGVAARPASTHGFAAPENRFQSGQSRVVCDNPTDLFSLGATIFYTITSIPPWLVPEQDKQRSFASALQELVMHAAHTHPSLNLLLPMILGLIQHDSQDRWDLPQATEYLQNIQSRTSRAAEPTLRQSPHTPETLFARCVSDGMALLQQSLTFENRPRLWLPATSEQDSDPCALFDGAAGLLPVLTLADQLAPQDEFRATIQSVANWINHRLFTVQSFVPGLLAGRAGTAWTLYDAAKHLDDHALAERAIQLAKRLPTTGENPDIVHGLAGAGMAHLHLWQASADEELLERVHIYANSILEAAERQSGKIAWATPSGQPGKVNRSLGFAHGTAGIGSFLLAAAESTGREDCLEAATASADNLQHEAVIEDGAAWWTTPSGDRVGNWCNGSAGIGTFLLQAWHALGNPRYLETAEQAGQATLKRRWQQHTHICCGLAGAGEFMLDLLCATGEQRHHRAAQDIAALLLNRRQTSAGLLSVVPRDTQGRPKLGYSTGLTGVLGFLLRLQYGSQHAWSPIIPRG
ncbi:class IV lanthionine synthetase LanL [Streptomyces sp. NPDC002659]|uniref:class IV lanthionine synthetase LanL n=1 Tax=Streptomyces sp. NPDC002659 TaxID=3364656 RepID=UPI00368DEE23